MKDGKVDCRDGEVSYLTGMYETETSFKGKGGSKACIVAANCESLGKAEVPAMIALDYVVHTLDAHWKSERPEKSKGGQGSR